MQKYILLYHNHLIPPSESFYHYEYYCLISFLLFSVERLFLQLVKSGHPAVDPLVITQHSELSIKHELLFDPRALFCLFYIHG